MSDNNKEQRPFKIKFDNGQPPIGYSEEDADENGFYTIAYSIGGMKMEPLSEEDRLRLRLAEVTAERDEFRDLFTANYTLAKEVESNLAQLLDAVDRHRHSNGFTVYVGEGERRTLELYTLAAKIRKERS